MQCISTPLSDEQLFAVMSEIAEPDVVEHLRQCSFCKERYTELERAEERLRRRLYRWDCPDGEILSQFALDMLPEEQRHRIAEHVQTCPSCHKDLSELQQFWTDLDAAESHEQGLMSEYRPGNKLKRQHSADAASPAMRGVTAMRGEAAGGMQTFEQGNLRLRLSSVEEEGHYELMGQLSGTEVVIWRSAMVKAQQGNTRPVLSIVDNRDKFQCRLSTTEDVTITIIARNGTTITVEGVKIDPG